MTIPARSQTPWLRPARQNFYAHTRGYEPLGTELNPTLSLPTIWHLYRRQMLIGTSIGLAIGIAIKPLAALCLIVGMFINTL